MTLEQALGSAYRSNVLNNAKGKAIADLKQAFTDDADLKAEAEQFLADKAGPKNKDILQRCFITKTRIDLIQAALADN